jgi:hypothetical protein
MASGNVWLKLAERSLDDVSPRKCWSVSKRFRTFCASALTGERARVAATTAAAKPRTVGALRPFVTMMWARPATISAAHAERTKVSDSATVTTATPTIASRRARVTVR